MLDSLEYSRRKPRPCPGYVARPLCRVFMTYGFRIWGVVVGLGTNGLPSGANAF